MMHCIQRHTHFLNELISIQSVRALSVWKMNKTVVKNEDINYYKVLSSLKMTRDVQRKINK